MSTRRNSKGELEHRVLVHWPDIKAGFTQALEGRNRKESVPEKQVNLQRQLHQWRNNREVSWTGATHQQMQGWLRDGYYRPEFAHSGEFIIGRKRRKLRFGEEGEMQLDLVHSGHDYPYLDWDQRERKPGLRIVIDLCFHAGTKATMIAKYGAWCASLLGTLEANGYDLEVDIAFPMRALYENEEGGPYSGPRALTMMRVKNQNEASDFTEWSPIFSPGGFRMMGFYALCIGAEKLGKVVNSHYGFPEDNGMRVEFIPEERTLYLWTPNGLASVDPEDLSRQAREAGIL